MLGLVQKLGRKLAAPGFISHFLLLPQAKVERGEIDETLEAFSLADRGLSHDWCHIQFTFDGFEAVIESRVVLVHFVDEAYFGDLIPEKDKALINLLFQRNI